MKLTLLPTCLQCYLPELFLEVYFICWCYRYYCIHICRVWYDLFEKTNESLHTVQSVALGVCFSIV